jgi:hypothetical protein
MPHRRKAAVVLLFVVIAVFVLQQRPSGHLPEATASSGDLPQQVATASQPAPSSEGADTAAVAQPAARGILRDASPPGLDPPPQATRHRWVEVREDLFTAKRSPFWAAKDERRVELNLFPDFTLPVKIDHTEVLGAGRYGAQGTIEGRPGSRVLFAMAGDSLSVAVFDPELGTFVVEGVAPGVTIAYEVDPDFPMVCSGVRMPFLDQDAIAALARRESAVGGPPDGPAPMAEPYEEGTPVIDVMVVYSQELLNAAGMNNILSRIDLAIMEANSDFNRSEIAARLRLVHTALVNVQENGSFDTALDRLRRTDDGFMDGVHAVRDEFGADLVSLIVLNSNDSTVGQAYLMNEPWSLVNELFAFSVVQWNSLTGSSTFTHELGHNFGCAHSRHNASSPGAYGYSYGYKFNDTGGTLRRTIMAYTPGAQTRVFSNPRLRYPLGNLGGIPMGVPAGMSGESDNALTVDQSAFEVANYRLRADAFAQGHLINVSTRALVGSDYRQLIGGFVITGPPKTVIVRAIGPSLLPPPYNISNALLDPKLEIRPPSAPETLIAANDDWSQSPNVAALQATQWVPTDLREAAEILTLPAGDYTVLVSGKNNTAGIALVEIYEEGRNANKIINLSTRAWVDTGFNVMIGGFVIQGTPGETKRVLIRVLGPTLEDYQVPNALFDPAARLYNAAGEVLLDNDDWDAGPHQEQITALGRAPGNRREPCMLIDIAPGAYTVIVRPFENPPPEGIQPGIGLIEVYEITTVP